MKTPRHVIATALTQWVEKGGDPQLGPANQVKLCHVAEGRPPQKIQSWGTPWPGTNLQELTQSILDTANEHASSGKGTGVEEYYLIPYFGTESADGGFRRFFIHAVREAVDDEGAGGFSEGPTKTGMQHMGMRHLEMRHKQVDERDAMLWQNSLEELKRLRQENKDLRAELRAANEGLEEAKDRSLERKLQIYRANQEEERKDKLVDAVIPAGMMLANAAMGAPIFTVNTDQQSNQAVVHFLNSLKTNQIEAMAAPLDPQQRMFFDHMLEELKKFKIEEMKKRQAEANAKVNGVEQEKRTVENLAKRAPQAPDGGPNP